MFKKETDILQDIAGKLSRDKKIVKVIVYGSRVRGDYRGDSDIDILVVVEKRNPEITEKILDVFYSYELRTELSFSVKIFSFEELAFNKRLGSPFIKSIENEGMVIYDAHQRREKDTRQLT